ncbi:hypothetical protein FUAX_53290 (plasmid) [Fulvitalea axinellae]|uniref:DUF2589 domain-containing protein n=1 Tax=Fulvitalea axinellae TaxID=1182444 RepID=A0AAU9CYP6_9BACT|nr:hypothetical protein FUAX_53290 [Fulvitalea axinellae]
MAIDTTPSTVATNALQAIPFSSLIGGPLDAAIQAQAQAAKTSWEFIQQVGLNQDPATKEKSAVNVSFYYNKGGKVSKLIVPLLTIVPIPYIAIDEVSIDFKANISAASSSVSSTSSSEDISAGGSAKAKIGWGPFSVTAKFNANYSSKKDSKASEKSKYSVEYTMDVHVHAGQSDMPAGLATVLNILQSSITDADPKGSFLFNPTNPVIDVDALTKGSSDTDPRAFEIDISVQVKDSEGLVVPGKEVKFTPPATPLSGLTWDKADFTSAPTNKDGLATVKLSGKATPSGGSNPTLGNEMFSVSYDGLPDDDAGQLAVIFE